MEESQNILVVWEGRGKKGRGGRRAIHFTTASVTCHPHLGEGQTEGSLGGRANRKVSLWHLKASNLIPGPQSQGWRTKLCWGEGRQWTLWIPKLSLPCPVSRHQWVMSLQTNMRKPARRNDKGICQLRRLLPVRLDWAIKEFPLLDLDSNTLSRAFLIFFLFRLSVTLSPKL